ncbi:hypothetical protein EPN28_04125 [Patescibacteria group bacterium]|nr:MAG: hypothetical protein EPN28_04125 [Patescibacteria group bacterium]
MRLRVIILALVLLVAGLLAVFAGYGWFWEKQKRVAAGTARPTFPYGDYSLEELAKLYPQTVNENVPTKQAPEETHAKFVSALKAGKIDEAVECCFRKGDWGKMKEGLKRVRDKGEMGQMIKDLDAAIKPDFVGDTKASYTYIVLENGKKIGNVMTFIKNIQGIWLIESL